MTCITVLLTAGFLAFAQKAMTPDPSGPRPIDAVDSVWIEDLTWMEVRDALKAGKTTVLVPTGGVEQNGPYLVTGKHNVVLKGLCEIIARKLGNTLVAPVVAFVPEGGIEPPSGHMKYPGTISLTEETYERLLTDICASLKAHGFTRIVLLGDSGGNQKGMKAVADKLNARWASGAARAYFIPEFYDYGGLNKWVASQGIKQTDEGLHDDFVMTAQMLAVDPASARHKQRVAAKKATINGVDVSDLAKTQEWGRKIFDYRADVTIKALQAATGK
ncbi:MAG: creatininase family protein [Planctomycetia bacterium]|nr:creatininase family protein [Planctomycetia bacterium]